MNLQGVNMILKFCNNSVTEGVLTLKVCNQLLLLSRIDLRQLAHLVVFEPVRIVFC